MSLEIAISENTAAIHALIAALSNPSVAVTSGDVPAQAPVAKNSASSTPEGASMPKAEAAVKKSAKADEKPAADVATAPAAGDVTYEDAAAAVQALAKSKGRDAALAVLKAFGASKLPDVDVSRFADVVAACEAA